MRTFSRLLTVGVASLCATSVALACSCPNMSPAQRYDQAQSVFLGEALRYIKSPRGKPWTTIRFTVMQAWKGASGQTIDVDVPTEDHSCGIEILIGHPYLVYAQAQTDGTLTTTLCMGTSPGSEAAADFKYLTSVGTQPVEPAVPAKEFSDVPSDYPYAEAINSFREDGVLQGYSDHSFRPDHTISRAEVVKILDDAVLTQDAIWRNLQEYAYTDMTLPFSDIDARAWYNMPLRRAYRAGIIDGYKDGTFKPTKSVTVAEASKLLIQALKLESPNSGALWYERFIHAVADRQAMPLSVRSVDEPITRGEFIEILWRLQEHVTTRPSLNAESLLDKQCLQTADPTIPGVDLRKVRQVWLDWYNAEREKRKLPRYAYNPYLSRSAEIWATKSASDGVMTHSRDGGASSSYNYSAIKQWFLDLGLEFQNVHTVTFTENIGHGPYKCAKADCTQALIDAIRSTFDFYLSEESKSYKPHFNAIVSPEFEEIGLGIAVKNGQYYLAAHFGTALISHPPRLCSAE